MMLRAIQVHPHDVRGEGAENVIRTVTAANIDVISPEVSTLEERHPYPRGELPHNPVHKVVTTSACTEVPASAFASARKLPFSARFSDEAARGQDYVKDLFEAADKLASGPRKIKIIPWLKALNASFDGDIENYCVVSADGEHVKTWLCPRREESFSHVMNLIDAMRTSYGADTVLLDRLRYPDWSGASVSISRMMTCFCPECIRGMKSSGLDPERLRGEISELPYIGDIRDVIFGAKTSLIPAWLGFRRRTITDFARRLREETRGIVKLWLNLWPPSFAKFLGQDYEALGKLCDGAKHFPYHKLGGGADLKGLVEEIECEDEKKERLFALLLKLMNIPQVSFRDFAANGFPASFVRTETALAKAAFGKTPVFSGIQIWDIPEDEISEACDEAIAGGADGFYFYCYGWATLEALQKCASFQSI